MELPNLNVDVCVEKKLIIIVATELCFIVSHLSLRLPPHTENCQPPDTRQNYTLVAIRLQTVHVEILNGTLNGE